MRTLLAWLALVVGAFMFLLPIRAVWADAATHVFQVSCLPEINLFEIRDVGGTDEPTGLFDGAELDLTGKAPVLYAPERHVDLSGSPYQMEDVPANPNYGIHSTRFECRLRSVEIELIVFPEPAHRAQSDVVRDIAVTLRVAGHTLVDDVPFYPCEESGQSRAWCTRKTPGIWHFMAGSAAFGRIR